MVGKSLRSDESHHRCYRRNRGGDNGSIYSVQGFHRSRYDCESRNGSIQRDMRSQSDSPRHYGCHCGDCFSDRGHNRPLQELGHSKKECHKRRESHRQFLQESMGQHKKCVLRRIRQNQGILRIPLGWHRLCREIRVERTRGLLHGSYRWDKIRLEHGDGFLLRIVEWHRLCRHGCLERACRRVLGSNREHKSRMERHNRFFQRAMGFTQRVASRSRAVH